MTWLDRIHALESKILFKPKETQMEISLDKSSKKMNILSYPDFYKLTRWVDENKEKIRGLSQEQISRQAAAETDLLVTVSNIRAVATTLNIALGHAGGYRGAAASSSKDINRLLARSIVDLYTKLGEPVPDALKAIATR